MANSPSALRLSPAMLESARGVRFSSTASVAGLSISGVLLLLTGVLVFGSGFLKLRPEVMGLRLHPYLIPVVLATPFVFLTRLHAFPTKIFAALAVFTAVYLFSIFSGAELAVGELFKIGSAVMTITTCAMLVRKRGDFVAGVIGLGVAAAVLAYHGLTVDTTAGVEAVEGANKNSYSLFALPAILLAGYVALSMPTVPVLWKSIPVICAMPALAAIFMSANRSGYLGAVLVGLMLSWNRRARGLMLIGAVATIVAYGILQYGSTKVFDERLRQTFEGNKSDTYRRDILYACLDIAFQNPLIGVSPQQLPFEIGRRTSNLYHYGVIESHNVFAHVVAGSGFLCFALLAVFGYTMWNWKPRDGVIGDKGDPARDARALMRMMIVLWCLRGMFTREILYNPSFNIALGLVIGLCMLAEAQRQGRVVRARPAT